MCFMGIAIVVLEDLASFAAASAFSFLRDTASVVLAVCALTCAKMMLPRCFVIAVHAGLGYFPAYSLRRARCQGGRNTRLIPF